MKRLSLVTQFKIELLLLFASCRKVVGKMPIQVDNKLRICSQFLLFNMLIMVNCPLFNGVIESSSKMFKIADGKFGQTGGGKNRDGASEVLTVIFYFYPQISLSLLIFLITINFLFPNHSYSLSVGASQRQYLTTSQAL